MKSPVAAGTVAGLLAAAGTVMESLVASGMVVESLVAAETVVESLFAAGTVVEPLVAAGTVVETLVAAGTVVESLVAAGMVVESLVAAGTVVESPVAPEFVGSHSMSLVQEALAAFSEHSLYGPGLSCLQYCQINLSLHLLQQQWNLSNLISLNLSPKKIIFIFKKTVIKSQ